MSIAEKLQTIAENEQKVYDAGHNSGYNEAYDAAYEYGRLDGMEIGREAEYDAFWDAFQQNGERTSYNYAFASSVWSPTILKPKYPIKLTTATGMFENNTNIVDFDDFLSECGMQIDWSEASVIQYSFRGCANLTRIGTVAGRSMSYAFYALYKLHTIDKITFTEGSQTFTDTFRYSTALKNINAIAGTIRAAINFSSNPLTHDSLMNIINALYNYSDEGGSYTLTLGTKNLANLTDAEKAIATQKGWTLA